MRPILFQIWRIPVFSYGFLLAVAFVVGTILGVREAKRRGINPDKIIDLALYTCIAGIIGARLLFILLDIPTYFQDPVKIVNLRDGGLSFQGGLASAILVGIWYSRREKLDAWVLADIAAPIIPLGYALVRVGCLLNGCCYGLPAGVPWALAAKAGDQTLRHPTQVYAALLSLVIFAVLFMKRNHKKFPGYLMFLYVGLYSVARFIVEIFRDVPRMLGPLSITQLASIVVAFGAFACIALLSSDELRQERSGQAVGRE
ncbi:MAG: prolipoprotein diacylglyceryl transferase [Firmicutes bacterium]|nr:prolipoprotein diacylglyceryl transferase [Bacillota bacterium]MDH7496444.1 prolipoprotein diacylglyceryl transferase [Bacillota bacterium]